MSAPGAPLLPTPAAFRHEAVMYAGGGQFVSAVLPFIEDALAAEEPILVAIDEAKIALLRAALGPRAAAVEFEDMTALGQNPARIIPAWRAFLDRHARQAPQARGIGEPIWAGRTDAEIVECQRHEALLNVALIDACMWLICPYDTQSLDARVLDEAWRSHPFVVDGDGNRHGGGILSPEEHAWAHMNAPLPPPAALCDELSFDAELLRDVRDIVADHAIRSGMGAGRAFDLLIAVSEIATNSLLHGGGYGTLRVWHDAETVICEFSDRGQIVDPLAGRRPPLEEAEGQRGLWLANQLCDLVQIRNFSSGTVVRLHMAVNAPL